MSNQFSLEGKVVLVTGAGSGLGQAIALAVADAGAKVALTELPHRMAAGEQTAETIRRRGQQATAIPLDQTDLGQIEEAVRGAVSQFGRLDVLVNNAGIGAVKPSLEITERDWDTVLDIDLKGAFFCAQAAARQMIRQGGGGRIVNVASILGVGGFAQRVSYCAAKAGLINVTRVLAVEWAEHNLNVNAVAPGYVGTEPVLRRFGDPGVAEEILGRTPMKRLGQPEEIGSAVVYLASPAASYVTGATLLVDGGWTAW